MIIFKMSRTEHALAAASSGRFQWSKDAQLYQLPPERELLPDRARRLMFQSYLKFAGLPYTEHLTKNADYMSHSGMAPFLMLKFGDKTVLYDDIFKLADFLEAQDLSLGHELDGKENADCQAFISLVKNTLLVAMEYETWMNAGNWPCTSVQFGHGLPWPLRSIVPRLQWAWLSWTHWDLFWSHPDCVLAKFRQSCQALSTRLARNECFFSCGPTMLDVAVYGCVEAIVSYELPSGRLKEALQEFSNLERFSCNSILTQRKGLQFISSPSSANLVMLESKT